MEGVNPMADHDPREDITPKNNLHVPRRPTVAALKAALTTHNATSYSAARLQSMTYNDLVYAARQHSLSVVGL